MGFDLWESATNLKGPRMCEPCQVYGAADQCWVCGGETILTPAPRLLRGNRSSTDCSARYRPDLEEEPQQTAYWERWSRLIRASEELVADGDT